MTPSKTSCMPSFKRMGPQYGENDGMPLHQKFHYESISTWLERTKSSLSMWWLLIRCRRQWLWMSLLDQHVQLWNLMPLLRFVSIESIMRGTILFQWPWRCMVHSSVIWIVSFGSVFVFFTIDNQEVIYLYLFAFNFLGSILILPFNVL